MSDYNNVTVNTDDEFFDAVWEAIKRWDIGVPDAYHGHCGANGNHVQVILDAIKQAKAQKAYDQAMKGMK